MPVDVTVCVGRLPAAVEATAYFVVGEALTNVTGHARAVERRVGSVEERTARPGVSRDPTARRLGRGGWAVTLDAAGGSTCVAAYCRIPQRGHLTTGIRAIFDSETGSVIGLRALFS
jgi:hypothetical protein